MTGSLIDMILLWYPFVLMAVLVYFLVKRGRASARSEEYLRKQLAAQAEAQQATLYHLDRIATALEQRKA